MGGTSLVLAPLLLLAGVLLRLPFHFFFPQQLAGYQQEPALMTAAYSCFVLGNILLWPAILTLAQRIAWSKPGWAAWGAGLTLCGLFARTFHAGVDHLAFQSVRIHGAEAATRTMSSAYGAFHVISVLTPAILFGWIVLAIGAYLSGTLGVVRSVCLGSMAALMIGVLKGTSATSVVACAGLCVALLPLGFRTLREPPVPSLREYALWIGMLAVLSSAMFLLGSLG